MFHMVLHAFYTSKHQKNFGPFMSLKRSLQLSWFAAPILGTQALGASCCEKWRARDPDLEFL